MRMLRIQFYYLMNRVSLTFMILSSVLLTAAFLHAGHISEGWASMDAFREWYRVEFLRESVGVAKFVLIATALFLHIHCFLAGNGKYSAFFVSDRKSRIGFMVTKLAMAELLVAVSVLQAWVSYRLIGAYLTPYSAFSFEEGKLFLWIGAEALCFGLLEALVMQITDSVFSGILPLFLYWFLEMNAGGIPKEWDFLGHLIPHLVWTEGKFVIGTTVWEWGLFAAGLFLMNIEVFKRRDIK